MVTPADYGWKMQSDGNWWLVVALAPEIHIFMMRRCSPWWWPWLDRWQLWRQDQFQTDMIKINKHADVDRCHYAALAWVADYCTRFAKDPEVRAAERRFLMRSLMHSYQPYAGRIT